MPQRSKGPRLILRPARAGSAGSRARAAVWIIRDTGGRERSTGCSRDDFRGAEHALLRYLAETRSTSVQAQRRRDPASVPIADVLILYWNARHEDIARPEELRTRLRALTKFWTTHAVDDITPATCADYVRHRGSPSAARRELEDLRAAVNHAHDSRVLSNPVPVVLPARAPAREQWLTRSEAARLIWAAWRYREVQKGHVTDRYSRRHVARWILCALYTGSRSGVVSGASLLPSPASPYVDLEHGILYRAGAGERVTKKRKPSIRIPARLLAHMRRWHRLGIARHHVIEFNGRAAVRVGKAFANAVREAGLDPDVTPHTIRHTAVTWAMQGGADPWEAAGFFGMTRELIESRYGHHSPDHQESVHRAFGGQLRAQVRAQNSKPPRDAS